MWICPSYFLHLPIANFRELHINPFCRWCCGRTRTFLGCKCHFTHLLTISHQMSNTIIKVALQSLVTLGVPCNCILVNLMILKLNILKTKINIFNHKPSQRLCNFSSNNKGNYSGRLIGRTIAILYFLARRITAKGAEERRVVNRLFPLRVPPRTLPIDKKLRHRLLVRAIPSIRNDPIAERADSNVCAVCSQDNVENQKVQFGSTARIKKTL
ncbi:MAG: hypothetical protein C5S47_07730 [Candidatus Methanogasteraceae archaeon]|nr:MAG: hypothetical protein C5S47_07730 [ANME-2 cluster archaeon]